MTKETLLELVDHMEWADRLVMGAAQQVDEASADDYLLKTLLHLHVTQFAFLGAWQGEMVDWRALQKKKTLEEVSDFAGRIHGPIRDELSAAQDLAAPLTLPWAEGFGKRFLKLDTVHQTTFGETAYQVVAHSNYHRGQANRRIRELGGAPPTVDYIVWVWMGRPAPNG